MKLGNLNAIIRKEKLVRIPVYFANGERRSIRVQKTDFIEQLQDAYDKDRTAETGMELSDGELRGLLTPVIDKHGLPATELEDDLDDLLGSGESTIDDLLS